MAQLASCLELISTLNMMRNSLCLLYENIIIIITIELVCFDCVYRNSPVVTMAQPTYSFLDFFPFGRPKSASPAVRPSSLAMRRLAVNPGLVLPGLPTNVTSSAVALVNPPSRPRDTPCNIAFVDRKVASLTNSPSTPMSAVNVHSSLKGN